MEADAAEADGAEAAGARKLTGEVDASDAGAAVLGFKFDFSMVYVFFGFWVVHFVYGLFMFEVGMGFSFLIFQFLWRCTASCSSCPSSAQGCGPRAWGPSPSSSTWR